ncbi:MAG: indolepyruvate oxidoreductase subunit beta [Oscillospiraceae bacterium]|nr:indolepyruvate oxidoreductase subunit beta [Oscillospiraceae bacterium]
MANTNILIVGVGGQGTVLASKILGALFMERGQDVKVSEVHGMSQRGGSVITFVRAGENVASPLIEQGTADVIISFELLEAQRYAAYLKKGGTIIVNSQQIDPMPVITGAAKYPENIRETIADLGINAVYVDATDIAVKAGNAKAANVALLGAASNFIGGSAEEWEKAVLSCVPAKFAELNKLAFELGRSNN